MVRAHRQARTRTLEQEAQLRGRTIARLMAALFNKNEQTSYVDSTDYLNSLSPDALRQALHDDPVWLAFDLAGVDIDAWDGDTDSLSEVSERALKDERAQRT